jgi:hypothetical protein
LLWWCQGGQLEATKVPLGETELVELSTQWRLQLRAGAADWGAGHRLAAHLLGPIEQQFGRVDEVVVTPVGALWGVPYEALPVGGDGERLGYKLGVRTLWPGAPRGPEPPAAKGWLALLANEEGDLPFARVEREALAHEGARAETLDHFALAASQHRRLYLGVHGIEPTPTKPYGAVAWGGHSIEGSQLAGLDLAPVDLVVAMGCTTGGSMPGDWPQPGGVARAFLVAGAHAVIASRWPIDDFEAASLGAEIVRQLGQGHEPSQALRNARILVPGAAALGLYLVEQFSVPASGNSAWRSTQGDHDNALPP